ncbi:hypothetical protein OSJ57_18545 [Sphingomonas sp. HH69]
MKARNLLPAVAAFGLVFAPVAAEAGTSASSAMGAASVGSRTTSTVRGKDKLTPAIGIVIALAAAAGGYGISQAVKSDHNKSNGAR